MYQCTLIYHFSYNELSNYETIAREIDLILNNFILVLLTMLFCSQLLTFITFDFKNNLLIKLQNMSYIYLFRIYRYKLCYWQCVIISFSNYYYSFYCFFNYRDVMTKISK